MSKNRFDREENTFRNMVGIYCRSHHEPSGSVCGPCEELVQYVMDCVIACRYGDDKPVCGKCSTHCYAAEAREQVRQIMAFAGPRMMVHHPVLAIRHCIDAMKTRQHN